MCKVISSGINQMQKIERPLNDVFNDNFVKLVEKDKPDILHVNNVDQRIFEVKDVSKIFVIHGGLDLIGDKPVFCQKMQDIYSRVGAIVVPSRHAAENLRRYCGIEATVINHGVDMQLFNPSIPKHFAKIRLGMDVDSFIILWNARMDSLKGLHTLINALSEVGLRDFKTRLYIKTRTINKSYFQYIKYVINKRSLGKIVLIDRSWTPLNLMPLYYRAADIYVNTSYSEAFGSLSMLEAMACGVPVIARNRSSNPEALGSAGLLFNNEDELAEAIEKFTHDTKLRTYYARKSVSRIIEGGLALDNIAERYFRLYNSI